MKCFMYFCDEISEINIKTYEKNYSLFLPAYSRTAAR